MGIKAIALDIDGTLTNDNKVITERTREALLAAQGEGVKLILSSGRPIQGLRALAAELSLDSNDGLLVAFNGAHVVDAQTDEVLYDQPLPASVLRELIVHLRDFDVIPWVTEGDHLCLQRGCRHEIIYRGAPFDAVDYECRICDLGWTEVDDLREVCTRPQDKLLVASEPEYLQEHWREMYEPFKDSLSGMFTADFYYEFMAPGISKGNALAGALSKLGIDASEVIAFGDAENDISMLSWAGTGVAMGNATAAVKAIADYVTLSNNDDGIAVALAEFLG